VLLCFSLASIKMVNTSSAVRMASTNRPRGMLVVADREVRTFSAVGKRPRTSAEATIPPVSWATRRKTARIGLIARVRRRARVTLW
jgi:hypothetical protein